MNKLKTVPVDLSKLSNVVKNEVVIKTVYAALTAVENKTPDVSNLVKKNRL